MEICLATYQADLRVAVENWSDSFAKGDDESQTNNREIGIVL